MAPVSSTVASWELATRLRSQRQALGVDVSMLSRQLGFTRNYWSAVENGRTVLAEDKLAAAATLLGMSLAETRELQELRETTKLRGWWQAAQLDEPLSQFVGLEHGASLIRSYEGLLVNGLLQTEEYARAVMETHVSLRPVDVDRLVAARLRRQERLSGDAPLRVTAVMNEAALHQQLGRPGLLRRQLEHLGALAQARPATVEIRVLPFTAPPSAVTSAATVYLLDFDSRHLPTVAWQEATNMIGLTEDQTQVHALELAYAQALDLALSPEQSLAFIGHLADRLPAGV